MASSAVTLLETPLNLGRILPWAEPNANLAVKEEDGDAGAKKFTIGDSEGFSEAGIMYWVRNEQTGEPLRSKEGEDGKIITIDVPADKLNGATSFDILAVNKETCIGAELIQVYLLRPIVLAGEQATIIVKSSQKGLTYELVDAANEETVMTREAVTGNGQNITLLTKALTTDVILRLGVTKEDIPRKVYRKDFYIDILREDLPVRPKDPVVIVGEATKVQVGDSTQIGKATQADVSYQLFYEEVDEQQQVVEQNIGDEQEGNGGMLEFDTGAISAPGREFKVRASIKGAESERVFLRQTASVETLRTKLQAEIKFPDQIPAYQTPVYKDEDGKYKTNVLVDEARVMVSRITLQDTQEGVDYQFIKRGEVDSPDEKITLSGEPVSGKRGESITLFTEELSASLRSNTELVFSIMATTHTNPQFKDYITMKLTIFQENVENVEKIKLIVKIA